MVVDTDQKIGLAVVVNYQADRFKQHLDMHVINNQHPPNIIYRILGVAVLNFLGFGWLLSLQRNMSTEWNGLKVTM